MSKVNLRNINHLKDQNW